MDHAAHAELSGGLEQVPGADGVDVHGGRIVGREGAVDAAQVDDHFDVTERCPHGVEIAQVGIRDVELAHVVDARADTT